jgi:hypothetical protein
MRQPLRRTYAIAALATCAAVTTPAYALASPAPHSPPSYSLVASVAGAQWLARQVTTRGFVVGSDHKASAGDTAQTVLALAATGVRPDLQRRATGYLRGRVNGYVRDKTGHDKAGEVATLLLVAKAEGIPANKFGGGSDLVRRLLATQQHSGANRGLFGSQDPTYDGAYRQGLAVLALRAAGTGNQSALGWLRGQECPDGGWQGFRVSRLTPCTSEDTNSTALAVEALATSHVSVGRGLAWLRSVQQLDGGWGYSSFDTQSDPDSTAVVIQALLAAGQDPTARRWHRSGGNPYSALDRFQLGCGARASARGAYYAPFAGATKPNLLATEQAVPAAAGQAFPLRPVATVTGSPMLSCGR